MVHIPVKIEVGCKVIVCTDWYDAWEGEVITCYEDGGKLWNRDHYAVRRLKIRDPKEHPTPIIPTEKIAQFTFGGIWVDNPHWEGNKRDIWFSTP